MENSKRHRFVYGVGLLTVGYYVGCGLRDMNRAIVSELAPILAKKRKEQSQK